MSTQPNRLFNTMPPNCSSKKSPSTVCAASTKSRQFVLHIMSITLETACELNPQVALRPESFGALAYHYGNRKLVFLKHPDVVAVVRDVADYATLQDALGAHDIQPSRWPSFVEAIDSLAASDIIRVR